MSIYKYERLSIHDNGDNATVTVYGKAERHNFGFNQSVPLKNRHEAAQQLAGPDYRVVPHEDGLWLSFHPGGTLLVPYDATVRVLHRAEPEPDPAVVAEIRQIIGDFLRPNGSPDGLTDHEVIRLAQALAGVQVEVPSDG